MLEEPDFLRGAPLLEEKDVGSDPGVGAEDPLGQAHEGVQAELFQQFALQCGLGALAEEKAVGQNHGCLAGVVFQKVHDQRHEEVGGLAGLVLAREVVLDTVLLHAAKGRVGDDKVHSISGAIILERAAQGVVMTDVGGHVDAVQHHVGHGQHVRQGFLLNAVDRFL